MRNFKFEIQLFEAWALVIDMIAHLIEVGQKAIFEAEEAFDRGDHVTHDRLEMVATRATVSRCFRAVPLLKYLEGQIEEGVYDPDRLHEWQQMVADMHDRIAIFERHWRVAQEIRLKELPTDELVCYKFNEIDGEGIVPLL